MCAVVSAASLSTACSHRCRPFPWSPQVGQAPGRCNHGDHSSSQQEASPGPDHSGAGGQPSEGRKVYRAPFPTHSPADGLPGPTWKGFGRAPSQPVCGGGVGQGCGLASAVLLRPCGLALLGALDGGLQACLTGQAGPSTAAAPGPTLFRTQDLCSRLT